MTDRRKIILHLSPAYNYDRQGVSAEGERLKDKSLKKSFSGGSIDIRRNIV